MRNAAVLCLMAILGSACLAPARADQLITHTVVLDSGGKLLAWAPYGKVIQLAWGAFKRIPAQANGLPTFYTYPRYNADPAHLFEGIWWAHNPAGLDAMLIDGALSYSAYSGDEEVFAKVRAFADYELEHGLTPEGWSWSRVPFASSFPGATEYRGADDAQICGGDACGRGDGEGYLEPDKVGELGYALLRLYERTGDARYRDEAIRCGDALAAHARSGDERHSPWPFRVDGETGARVREEYSANAIGPIQLFDELARLGLGDVGGYERARALAWAWLTQYPMRNMSWQAYFEDIPIHGDPSENPNQYSALETARYLLQHPELDPEWKAHAGALIDWAVATFAVDWEGRFGVEKGIQWGAEVFSEQRDDMAKMGSHTSRYASVQALWSEMTGDAKARERAFRSFNWASYVCSAEGVVKVGTNDDEGYWFSDGYGDYMRHFLSGMGSVPAWAPRGEDHLLRSSSVVRSVSYGPQQVAYATFDAAATEVLRLRAAPNAVLAGGQALARRATIADGEGYALEALPGGGVALRVRHERSGEVVVRLGW